MVSQLATSNRDGSSSEGGDTGRYTAEKRSLIEHRDTLNCYYDRAPIDDVILADLTSNSAAAGSAMSDAPPKKRYQSPDGGWGWLVVFASFVLQTLSIGVTYTFGILLSELMSFFNASESTLAWIGSIQAALLYFTGILAGPLIERFGWRWTAVFGCMLSACGYGSSALAPNIYVLYATYGVVTGVGNGLMYTTSMVVVQHYFEKRRAMATGVAVSGSGCGPFLFGLLLPFLFKRVAWRWSLAVLAVIHLLGVLTSLLFRPLPLLDAKPAVSEPPPPPPPPSEVDVVPGDAAPRRCCSLFRDVIDVEILRDPVFIVFCVSVMLFCLGYHVPYVYTPVRAEKACGISAERAAMLVSVMGVANVASRLVFGWLADRSEAMRFYLGAAMLVAIGAVSIVIFLFNTYAALLTYSTLFGVFTGCWVALFPCLLVDLLGINKIERSLGHCMAFCSVVFLVATPLSGWIINASGSYNLPFIVVGSADAFGGLIFLSIRVIRRRSRRARADYQTIGSVREVTQPRKGFMYSGSFS